MAVSRMRNKKYAIYPLFMAELPKLPRLMGNLGRGIRRWRQILGRKWKMAVSRMHSKNTLYTLIYGGIAEIPASCRKSGSRNMMVTSDVRLEMEIWPFCPCTVKIRNITLVIGTLLSLCSCCVSSWMKNQLKTPSNHPNFAIYKEIGVKESNVDVRIILPEPPN